MQSQASHIPATPDNTLDSVRWTPHTHKHTYNELTSATDTTRKNRPKNQQKNRPKNQQKNRPKNRRWLTDRYGRYGELGWEVPLSLPLTCGSAKCQRLRSRHQTLQKHVQALYIFKHHKVKYKNIGLKIGLSIYVNMYTVYACMDII